MKGGGLRVPDLKLLNGALKLRQFLQASKCNHTIKLIQKYLLEKLDYDYVINQEYSRLSGSDPVIRAGQLTLNSLTDKWRAEANIIEEVSCNRIRDLIASTDIKEFLKRKNVPLITCIYERLFRSGIENYKQLIMEKTYPRSDSFSQLATSVSSVFPVRWERLIAENLESNSAIDVRENIVINTGVVKPAVACNVKEIRNRLIKNDSLTPKYVSVLGIEPHININPFVTARLVNHSMSQKIFKFRLLHLDIFTKHRMFKLKMVENEACEVCGEIETLKHAIWECNRAKKTWQTFSAMLEYLSSQVSITFDTLFVGFNPTNSVLESVITKLTQSLMSYDRGSMIGTQNVKRILYNYATLNKYKTASKKRMEMIDWEKIIEWAKDAQ